jgi:hypothetical protein
MAENGPQAPPKRDQPEKDSEALHHVDPAKVPDLTHDVDESVAGVQGAPSRDQADDEPSAPKTIGGPPDKPAPDSGEIEWAGQVVKKPPSPSS